MNFYTYNRYGPVLTQRGLILVQGLIYIYCLCMAAAMALPNQHICTGSTEPLLCHTAIPKSNVFRINTIKMRMKACFFFLYSIWTYP